MALLLWLSVFQLGAELSVSYGLVGFIIGFEGAGLILGCSRSRSRTLVIKFLYAYPTLVINEKAFGLNEHI